jgi:hypothetical protein
MLKRPNATQASTVNLQFRATEDEAARAKELASHENLLVGKSRENFSDLVRRLLTAERRRIVVAERKLLKEDGGKARWKRLSP